MSKKDKHKLDRFYAVRLFPTGKQELNNYQLRQLEIDKFVKNYKLQTQIQGDASESDTISVTEERQLLETGIFTGLELENKICSSTNLSNSNWQSAHLKNFAFIECDLTNAVFSNSRLSNCIFYECNLTGVDFRNSRLDNNWIENVGDEKNSRINFNLAITKNCIIKGNFAYCDMSKADMHRAWFRLADLSRANLYKTNLQGAVFDVSVMEETIMPNGKAYHFIQNATHQFTKGYTQDYNQPEGDTGDQDG